MSVMGIDPGQKGALGIMHSNAKEPRTRMTYLLEGMTAGEFEDLINTFTVHHVYIEKVGAMPGQGVTSMFTFGQGFGRLIGWVEMLKIPYSLVSPQSWQKELHKGCSGDDPKKKTLQAVQRLFPDHKLTSEKGRVPHMGIVDALAITEYGRRAFR